MLCLSFPLCRFLMLHGGRRARASPEVRPHPRVNVHEKPWTNPVTHTSLEGDLGAKPTASYVDKVSKLHKSHTRHTTDKVTVHTTEEVMEDLIEARNRRAPAYGRLTRHTLVPGPGRAIGAPAVHCGFRAVSARPRAARSGAPVGGPVPVRGGVCRKGGLREAEQGSGCVTIRQEGICRAAI